MQSGHTSGAIRRNQTQSDAIRRNHEAHSGAFRRNHSDAISMPGALCLSCFRVLGGPQGPVFCVIVFWAGTTGLCFVFCVLGLHNGPVLFVFSCFGRPPSKHSTGAKPTQVRGMHEECTQTHTRSQVEQGRPSRGKVQLDVPTTESP